MVENITFFFIVNWLPFDIIYLPSANEKLNILTTKDICVMHAQ